MSMPTPAKLAVTIILAALACSAAYLYTYNPGASAHQTTDDAYIADDFTVVAPKISGIIEHVSVDDNQPVQAGQLLATIDNRDVATALASAQADLAIATADVQRAEASMPRQSSIVDQTSATIHADEATLAFARANAKRYLSLASDGSGTMQERQQSDAQQRIAEARVAEDIAAHESARRQMAILSAERDQASARLAKAQATVAAAQLNLSYTRIVAPMAGMVGKRTVRAGAFVNVGTPLLALVPLDKVYIEANFRETQLARMRPGQAVTIRVDTLPGKTLTGHVDSIAPASGIAFSAIAPDNATGNFTKVVQRIPVKILIDANQADARFLRVGMSVIPTVDVTSGANAS